MARRTPGLTAAWGVSLLLAAACGDDSGGGAESSSTADSAADDFAPPTTANADTANAETAPGDDGADTATTGSTATPCTSTADCADDELCAWIDDSCGASGLIGECTPRSTTCDNGVGRPVCGCDGVVYDTLCAAQDAGQDVDFLGGCATPAGAFDCGFSFCITGDEYCQQQGGALPTAECTVLPPVCQPPDCSCITTCCGCDNASCCSEFCTNDNDALTYTCPG
jgi:hypothetical protein